MGRAITMLGLLVVPAMLNSCTDREATSPTAIPLLSHTDLSPTDGFALSATGRRGFSRTSGTGARLADLEWTCIPGTAGANIYRDGVLVEIIFTAFCVEPPHRIQWTDEIPGSVSEAGEYEYGVCTGTQPTICSSHAVVSFRGRRGGS